MSGRPKCDDYIDLLNQRVDGITNQIFKGQKFEPAQFQQLADPISNAVVDDLGNVFPNFKIIADVQVVKKGKCGLNMTSTTLWEAENDGYYSYHKSNVPNLDCFVNVYLIPL